MGQSVHSYNEQEQPIVLIASSRLVGLTSQAQLFLKIGIESAKTAKVATYLRDAGI
jgi:hypothetical protein